MYSAIQTSQNVGMQTLDQNLLELVQKRLVTPEEAMLKAANKDQFKNLGAGAGGAARAAAKAGPK